MGAVGGVSRGVGWGGRSCSNCDVTGHYRQSGESKFCRASLSATNGEVFIPFLVLSAPQIFIEWRLFLVIDRYYVLSCKSNITSNIQHFNFQLTHTTLKNLELLRYFKISKTAPTCFGLQGNHHQGATVST